MWVVNNVQITDDFLRSDALVQALLDRGYRLAHQDYSPTLVHPRSTTRSQRARLEAGGEM